MYAVIDLFLRVHLHLGGAGSRVVRLLQFLHGPKAWAAGGKDSGESPLGVLGCWPSVGLTTVGLTSGAALEVNYGSSVMTLRWGMVRKAHLGDFVKCQNRLVRTSCSSISPRQSPWL